MVAPNSSSKSREYYNVEGKRSRAYNLRRPSTFEPSGVTETSADDRPKADATGLTSRCVVVSMDVVGRECALSMVEQSNRLSDYYHFPVWPARWVQRLLLPSYIRRSLLNA